MVSYNASGAVKATLLMAKNKGFSPAMVQAQKKAKEILANAFNCLGKNPLAIHRLELHAAELGAKLIDQF